MIGEKPKRVVNRSYLREFLKDSWPQSLRGQVTIVFMSKNGDILTKSLPDGCVAYIDSDPSNAERYIPQVECEETHSIVKFENGSWQ